jgi:hypothetical protein
MEAWQKNATHFRRSLYADESTVRESAGAAHTRRFIPIRRVQQLAEILATGLFGISRGKSKAEPEKVTPP